MGPFTIDELRGEWLRPGHFPDSPGARQPSPERPTLAEHNGAQGHDPSHGEGHGTAKRAHEARMGLVTPTMSSRAAMPNRKMPAVSSLMPHPWRANPIAASPRAGKVWVTRSVTVLRPVTSAVPAPPKRDDKASAATDGSRNSRGLDSQRADPTTKNPMPTAMGMATVKTRSQCRPRLDHKLGNKSSRGDNEGGSE